MAPWLFGGGDIMTEQIPPAPPGPPQQTPPPPMQPQPKKGMDRKKLAIIIGIIGIVVVILIVVGVVSSGDSDSGGEQAETVTEQTEEAATVEEEKERIPIEITSPESMQGVMDPNIMVAGNTEPGLKVTIEFDSQKVTCESDESGYFATVITLPQIGNNTITATVKTDEGSGFANVYCVLIEDPGVYKATCTTIDYRVLEKNADAHTGERFYARGEVFQIMEEGNTTFMLVAVTPGSYDIWDDNVCVLYDGTTDALEDSIIHFWGECLGGYTYESVAGYNITVPQIQAKIIEVEKI